MKTTIEKVLLFRANATSYIEFERKGEGKRTKFSYALEKMISRTNEVAKKYSDYMEDQRVERASVDEKGNVIETGKGQMSFTKEQRKLLNKDSRDKQAELVEVDPYYATEVPESLGEMFKDVFMGFVIDPEKELKKEVNGELKVASN